MTPRNSTRTRRECFDKHKWVHPVTGRIMLTCHLCGGDFEPATTKWDAEHVIRRVLKPSDSPDDVLPAHAGKNSCHAIKTAADNSATAKGKRIHDRHFNIKQSSGFGWNKKFKKKISGEVVER